MSKRTLDTFFQPVQKKPKIDITPSTEEATNHPSYPFSIPQLPPLIQTTLVTSSPSTPGKAINDQPDLDLLYFAPYIPSSISTALFSFLRQELFFYRVKYKIQRGELSTEINTPRYTSVFGVDASSFFSSGQLLDSASKKPVPRDRYKCFPRPIPSCLDMLRQSTEKVSGEKFNFCLVNYYADGEDSISYHSDDEKFLGLEPAIASFSLGAKRDFLMKRKALPPNSSTAKSGAAEVKPLKLQLASGDMVVMRGKTQGNWLHSIPKRKGEGRGRINITFRRAVVRGGTENYYRYNVGDGEVFRWDGGKMVVWEKGKEGEKGEKEEKEEKGKEGEKKEKD